MLLTLFTLSYVSYSEQSNFKTIGTHRLGNTIAFLLCIFTVILMTVIHNIFADSGDFLRSLSNPLLWIVIMLDIPVAFIKKKNYQYNGSSVTSISGSMQLSFVFLPLVAYLIHYVMGIQAVIPSLFDGILDLFIYSCGMCIFLFFYLKKKIQLNQIGSLFFLLLTPFWMSFTLYCFIVLLQIESMSVPFIIISAVNTLMFGYLVYKKGELALFDRSVAKIAVVEIIKIAPSKPISLLLVAHVPVEVFFIGKRVTQIFSSIYLDLLERKPINECVQDIVFAVIVITYTMCWAYL